MAERVTIETPEQVGFSVELADLGSRFLAIALDTLIQGMLIVSVLAAGGIGYLVIRANEEVLAEGARTVLLSVLAALGLLAGFLIVWGYHIGFETWMRGQSPGKRVVGLRVVKDSGAPVGFFDALIRNLLRMVDLLPANYAVGVISIFATRTHKRLGDLAAGTLVVREPRVRAPFDPGCPLGPSRQRLLADFLARSGELAPEARDRIAVRLAERLGVGAEGGGGGGSERDPVQAMAALARLHPRIRR